MKRSEKVYRDAAELLELGEEDFACHAINKSLGVSEAIQTKETALFKKVLKCSKNAAFYSYTATGKADYGFLTTTELGKSARALGLLLMAELVKENNPVLTD